MFHQKLKALANFSTRQQAVLRALVDSDLAGMAISEHDEQNLTRRASLIEQLPRIDMAYAAACLVAEREAEAAAARLARAKQELMDAERNVITTWSRGEGMKVPPQRERAEIENALRSGAEDRLPEARTLLLNIDEAVRHKLECVPTGVGTSLFGWGGESNEPRYVSNHDKVLPARAAIADAVAELAGLELAAVSYSEVSMALSEMFERLANITEQE